jgi:uracil-DNA glycosylase
MFAELSRTGYERTSPNLTSWAEQGVLLLNTILTTRLGESLAHRDFGWQEFTSSIIRHVTSLDNPLVVMLWGRIAQDFYTTAVPMENKHILLLKAYHPVACHYDKSKRFVGCNHFVEANEWLVTHGKQPIAWNK